VQYICTAAIAHQIVQAVRHLIVDPSLERPRLSSLVFGVSNLRASRDNQFYINTQQISGIEVFLVVIRVRKKTTTHFAVAMPTLDDGYERFFVVMRQREEEYRKSQARVGKRDRAAFEII